MNKKRVKRNYNHSTLEHTSDAYNEISERPSPFDNLDKFVRMHQTANFDGKCCCEVCRQRKPLPPREIIHYMGRKRRSKCLLKDIADCLVVKGRKPLRLYIPDICFFEDNQLTSFYCTNLRDRSVRLPYPIINEKQLESILKRHRYLYQQSMKLLFEKNIQGNIKFGEVHEKYCTTILPTHFYEGMASGVNTRTIHEQKRLVVHRSRDARLQLPVIANSSSSDHAEDQQYVVLYADGTYQMLNEVQFDSVISNRKAYGQMLYIKSYIKPKTDEDYTHEYRAEVDHNSERWKRAETLSAILNQEINIYDERYLSEEFFDEELEQLRDKPCEYIEVQVYRIVCYFSRLSRRRTTYLRSRWVLNDLNNYYLNDVLEWEWQTIPHKDLPPLVAAQHNPLLDSILYDENLFIETFKNTSRSIHKPEHIPSQYETTRLKMPSKALRSMSTIDETTLDTHASIRYDSSSKHIQTKTSQTLDPNEARVRRQMYSLSRHLPKKKNYQLRPMRFTEAQQARREVVTLPRNAFAFK